MIRRWMLALGAGLLFAAVAQAQIPVGNQSTFGRTAPGRAYPFLNGHGYGSTTDAGLDFPYLNRHGYSTTTDAGRSFPFLGQHAYGTAVQPGSQNPNASASGDHVAVTSLDTSPTVPLAFKAPPGLIFESAPGLIFKAPFQPFVGVSSVSPVISTVSPGSFQTAPFVR